MKSIQRQFSILVAIVLASACAHPATAQWFVDLNNTTDDENGLSWETAFSTIQPGIDAAFDAGGGEVWVAEGTYSEQRESIIDADPSDEEEFFLDSGSVLIRTNVQLIGGFVGSEATVDERDNIANITTISGAVSLDGGPARHVVVMETNSTLDGFTVTGGDSPTSAGIYAALGEVAIHNVVLQANTGEFSPSALLMVGGELINSTVLNNPSTRNIGSQIEVTDTLVENCFFREATIFAASFRGDCRVLNSSFLGNSGSAGFRDNTVVDGCVFEENGETVLSASARILNSVFRNNASSSDAGALTISNTFGGVVESCLFINNTAAENGGAIFVSGSRQLSGETDGVAVIVNSTFFGNTAGESGDAIFARDGDVIVQNSIFWNNCSQPFGGELNNHFVFTDCIVEGGVEPSDEDPVRTIVENVIDAAPQFVDAENGDFRLSATSPAIDSGADTVNNPFDFFYPGPFEVPETDIDGIERPQGAAYDLGAYEFVQNETGLGQQEPRNCSDEPEGEGEGEGEGEPDLEMIRTVLAGMMAELDVDSSGGLSIEEARVGVPGLTRAQFAMLDTDSDGSLSADELGVAGEGEGEGEGESEGMAEGEGEGGGEGLGDGEGAAEGESEGGPEGNGERGCFDSAGAFPSAPQPPRDGSLVLVALVGLLLMLSKGTRIERA